MDISKTAWVNVSTNIDNPKANSDSVKESFFEIADNIKV